MATRKTVYIIPGESGSGKTELGKVIAPLDCVFSADEMPGLYVNGVYQLSKQSESHEWCFKKFKNAVLNGREKIVVANTSLKPAYTRNYELFAWENGYTVHVARSEEVTLPDGTHPPNVHGTPDAIIQHQRDTYMPRNPPTPGISTREVAFAAKQNTEPSFIICDLNGTLIKPVEGKTFINKAQDARPVLDILTMLTTLKKEMIVLSNQCGYGGGKISEDDLKEIMTESWEWIEQANKQAIYVCRYFAIATHRNSPKYSLFHPTVGLRHYELEEGQKADKPNIGLLKQLINANNVDVSNIWYIGDSHVTGRMEDLQMVRNLQNDPTFKGKILYMPVEILGIVFNLDKEL